MSTSMPVDSSLAAIVSLVKSIAGCGGNNAQVHQLRTTSTKGGMIVQNTTMALNSRTHMARGGDPACWDERAVCRDTEQRGGDGRVDTREWKSADLCVRACVRVRVCACVWVLRTDVCVGLIHPITIAWSGRDDPCASQREGTHTHTQLISGSED
jgi:hypothetical protein